MDDDFYVRNHFVEKYPRQYAKMKLKYYLIVKFLAIGMRKVNMYFSIPIFVLINKISEENFSDNNCTDNFIIDRHYMGAAIMVAKCGTKSSRANQTES